MKKEGEEILLSSHARTPQANILYLDQKATKCMTCKWVYGKVQLFQHDSDQKTAWLALKRVFRQNFQGRMG